jgi:hypothetical protein
MNLFRYRKKNMEFQVECAVYGEGTVFPWRTSRDAKVSALQEAIFSTNLTLAH